MSEPDHLLSITTDPEGQQVFIHADTAGLEYLISSLSHLREQLKKGTSDHDHMMTQAWAGQELSTPQVAEGERPVQHLKIWAWTPEKIRENRPKA